MIIEPSKRTATVGEYYFSRKLAEVRRRIESRDLLFKVRVVSSELRERQREAILRRVGQSS